MERRKQGCRPRVSIVVVNYNGGRLLAEAVRAGLASATDVELILVDNGSHDDSLWRVRIEFAGDPRLRVIENGWNLGFTHASNIALARTRGEYVLLLNPDCVIGRDTLPRLIRIMEQHPQAGMAGCLIKNPDGTEQAGCRRTVPTPWRALVRVLRLDRLFPRHPRFQTFLLNREPLPERPVAVEAISGAFMLVRRAALQQVGPLDEGYFLHCEDLDWCMRVRQNSWQILFVPDVEVIHHKGECSADRPIFVLWHKHKGMVRFYNKFFRHRYPLPLMMLVFLAVWVRFAGLASLALIRHRVRPSPRRPQVAVPLPAFAPGVLQASSEDEDGGLLAPQRMVARGGLARPAAAQRESLH